MLIQIVLDMLAELIAFIVQSIPPMPPEISQMLAEVAGGAGFLGERISILGVVVPWGTATTILAVWVSLLGFWAIVLGVRFVLWVLGR